jgi:hypothetical protein
VQQPANSPYSNALERVAESLGSRIVAVQEIGGGRNSRVCKVDFESDTSYAVKFYYQDGSGDQSRLQREFSGLQFLIDCCVRCIPRPILADRDEGYAVYEYIRADRLSLCEIGEGDIDQIVGFVKLLKDASQKAINNELTTASEACFSVDALEQNIYMRLQRLLALPNRGGSYAELRFFLKNEFEPFLKDLIRLNNSRPQARSACFDTILATNERVLSPSDFGFHNVLRSSDGKLVFLDFEHFGWDDPAKLVADFLMHPHELMSLSECLKKYFADKILPCFGDRSDVLLKRLEVVYPLYALKWCMILLNEFIPEHWSRRAFAVSAKVDRGLAQMEQLDKARYMLAKSKNASENLPYWS